MNTGSKILSFTKIIMCSGIIVAFWGTPSFAHMLHETGGSGVLSGLVHYLCEFHHLGMMLLIAVGFTLAYKMKANRTDS